MNFYVTLCLLALFSNCIGRQIIIVDHVEEGLCLPDLGSISIKIYGTFSQNKIGPFDIEFITSEKEIIKSKCQTFEFNSLSNHYLNCEIDIALYYPLDDVDIYLPVNAPQIPGYKFVNWEEVIGLYPGTSNRFTISCLPYVNNIFNITSIVVNECIAGKRTFTIYGEWLEDKQYNILESDFDFHFFMEGYSYQYRNLVYCKYYELSSNIIKCQFDGGYINIYGNTYFNSGFSIYEFFNDDYIKTYADFCIEFSFEYTSGYLLYFKIINLLIAIASFF